MLEYYSLGTTTFVCPSCDSKNTEIVFGKFDRFVLDPGDVKFGSKAQCFNCHRIVIKKLPYAEPEGK